MGQASDAALKHNFETYGVPDIDGLAKQIVAELGTNPTSLALRLMDLMGHAIDTISLDPVEATQTLNRARFLLTRCCPVLNPAQSAQLDKLLLPTEP